MGTIGVQVVFKTGGKIHGRGSWGDGRWHADKRSPRFEPDSEVAKIDRDLRVRETRY